ncbi:MAG: phosphoenolpyruvate synthase [Rhodobacteraceae bacterium]|nr:phosphoenolpyruvate synthase [Paracoccaceae bacterium]
MPDFTKRFEAISKNDIALVGGKGANLGEMAGAGFPVPPGFCVTTHAYHAFTEPFSAQIYTPLEGLDPVDLNSVRAAGAAVRALMAEHDLPGAVTKAIVASWKDAGQSHAYAVRSSATAEDLPSASFAGQQDTYLNVIGEAEILAQVKNCFISLFTDRAILYRIQNGFPHHLVALSAVVQRMVMPDVSGILFTADPISENRNICSIDASFGLGEALVSGLVSADLYRVDKRSNDVLTRQIAEKKLAILPLKDGGTKTVDLPKSERTRAALNDAQVKALSTIGCKIEAHYGLPQDIEWALEGDDIFITQSRPITSLYPLAKAPDDALHVYLSLSHLQVMTDPMPELSISIWKYFSPIGQDENGEYRYLQNIGGRMYGEISPLLRNRRFGKVFIGMMSVADQLAQAAVAELATRPALYEKGERFKALRFVWALLPTLRHVPLNLFFKRPEGAAEAANQITTDYVAEVEASIAAAHSPEAKLGAALEALRGVLPAAGKFIPRMAAGLASQRILRKLAGPSNAERLNDFERGMVGNVVTDMNLAIGDLADEARKSEVVLSALKEGEQSAQARLDAAAVQGPEFIAAWQVFLQTYGTRGLSEIDASRPRWREDPTSLLQMIIGMTAQETSGTHRVHYEALTHASEAAAAEIPKHVGWLKRGLVKRLIRVARHLGPLREHHKFMMVQVLFEVKKVLQNIGENLAETGVLAAAEDIWFLNMCEIKQALKDGHPLDSKVAARRDEFALNAKRTPPRVVTSEGEIPRPNLEVEGAPNGALIGSPVSAGIYEGIANVVTDPATETLTPGEILVAPFTDPGWTPLFVNAGALVTEVGGLMTHGSVVAREYGIPAVVGVPEATQTIKTGDRLRVNGEVGYVEILKGEAP